MAEQSPTSASPPSDGAPAHSPVLVGSYDWYFNTTVEIWDTKGISFIPARPEGVEVSLVEVRTVDSESGKPRRPSFWESDWALVCPDDPDNYFFLSARVLREGLPQDADHWIIPDFLRFDDWLLGSGDILTIAELVDPVGRYQLADEEQLELINLGSMLRYRLQLKRDAQDLEGELRHPQKSSTYRDILFKLSLLTQLLSDQQGLNKDQVRLFEALCEPDFYLNLPTLRSVRETVLAVTE